MDIISVIEIIAIVILLTIAMIFIMKREKSKKKIVITILIINLILLAHLVVHNINREEKNTQAIDKQISAKVEQKDITAPIITIKGDKKITLKQGQEYQEPGYSAVDNKDGSVVDKVEIKKEQISNTQYKLIYIVKDAAGNIATTERIITIEEKQENTKPNNSNNNQSKPEKNTNNQSKPKKPTKNENKTGVIYLTFDDGPTTSSTPKILDILKKNNVKATFFIINYNNSTEYLVKREIQEGHSVGIHGYSHDYKQIYKSVDSYMENLNKLQTKIYNSTGVKTTLTRFPGGSSNTISKFNPKIMTKLSKEVINKGYRYYDWNISAGDADGARDSNAVYNNVVKVLYPNGNNFVLMHDFANNKKTIGALEKIIQYGKANGYTFKAITEETPMVKHKIFN